jgi:undecaprenyl diphosphate synthase
MMPALPRHIACIMDGNGRWAQARGLPRVEGHRAGAKTVRMLVEESRRMGIRHLTLFAFSSENWGRPPAEVSALMGLFERYLKSELDTLLKNDVRLRAIGELDRLPLSVQNILSDRQEKSAACTGMDLILAVSYGGRNEILRAVNRIVSSVRQGEELPEITEALLREHLYLPDLPDPDLLIRTSGENRISNFLLWQLAYTEICTVPECWPDLSAERYRECIEEYMSRERRYGLTGAQIQGGLSESSE